MSLGKLSQMSQECEDKLSRKILNICNPQKIARLLLKDLEEKVAEAEKQGEHKASSSFLVWSESQLSNTQSFDGSTIYGKISTSGYLNSFSDSSEREKASKLLRQMVQEYIQDNNIHLDLSSYSWYGNCYNYDRKTWLKVSVEW